MDFPEGRLKSFLKTARNRAWVAAAETVRPTLTHTTFVGITGSAGKTTAKALLVDILSRHMQGRGTPATANRLMHLAKLVCATKRSDRFCVAELGLSEARDFDRMLRVIRPGVGVVTCIGGDHVSAFGSREAIAAEKGKLIAALPKDGVAVLNADDPLVMAMRARSVAQVLTYGLDPAADVRATGVDATWPGRLRFDVVWQGVRAGVRTQLCGEHWVTAILAALAAGTALGVPLQSAVEAIASYAPMRGRMQPHRTRGGVDIVRDDWKAPLWTCGSALEFMRNARVGRKIVVFGTVSDVRGDASQQYRRLARSALEIADHVVFAGPWASRVLRMETIAAGKSLRAFGSVRQASDHLCSIAQSGDLVLLKGTNKRDHLERIVFAFDGDVACWRDDCGRESFCVGCRYLEEPSGPPGGAAARAAEAVARSASPPPAGEQAAAESPRFVVGLGNPGDRYCDTPHNVGHAVVDQLAGSGSAEWERAPAGWIASTRAADRELYLVKLDVAVNQSGAALRSIVAARHWHPGRGILVHDDVDLPVGKVRIRMRGSAGGHRGVASILDALQTDAIARVKVGVGRPPDGVDMSGHVLSPFPQESLALIRAAQAEAARRVLSLVAA